MPILKIKRIKHPQAVAQQGHLIIETRGNDFGRVVLKTSQKELRIQGAVDLQCDLSQEEFRAFMLHEALALHLVYKDLFFDESRPRLAYRYLNFELFQYGGKKAVGTATLRCAYKKPNIQKPVHRRIENIELGGIKVYEAKK